MLTRTSLNETELVDSQWMLSENETFPEASAVNEQKLSDWTVAAQPRDTTPLAENTDSDEQKTDSENDTPGETLNEDVGLVT
jgi:hypothetical protein